MVVWIVVFEKILIAVDGPKQSDAAFDLALDIGKRYGSEIFLINVYHGGLGSGTTVSTEYENDERSYGEEILNTYVNKPDEAQRRSLKPLLRMGDPAHEIIDTAVNEGCGLIILGSRGRGAFKELLLGSVSHKVTNHAGCTVLIVK